MPTPADKVQLLIGGKFHEDWESYEVDSDLLTPADAWQVSMGLRAGEMPPDVAAGALVEVRVGGETVMTGRVDEISQRVDKHAHTLSMSGRDGAAVLVDCSAPIFVAKQATLESIVAKVVRPLGINKIRIVADKTLTREKINVEPGDGAWDMLVNASEANGLWPWFDPDGTLVIGGPDYSQAEVATLILRRNGKGNNVLSLDLRKSIAERHSHLTVLGQTHGTATEQGKHNIGAKYEDPEIKAIAYRPKIVVDHESDNSAVAQARAEKLLSDAKMRGTTLTAMVKGHRISEGGELWRPGQRVRVVSDPHGIDAVWFLMARKFSGGRSDGAVTELTLKEDGVWVIKAHPHKRKHRRGKNAATGEIILIEPLTGDNP